jgi:hypothetical protein
MYTYTGTCTVIYMTLPDERYRAIKWTEEFLKDLCDRTKTPRVPKAVRQQASRLLRHYPSKYDLDRIAERAPGIVVENMEALHRMVAAHESRVDSENK